MRLQTSDYVSRVRRVREVTGNPFIPSSTVTTSPSRAAATTLFPRGSGDTPRQKNSNRVAEWRQLCCNGEMGIFMQRQKPRAQARRVPRRISRLVALYLTFGALLTGIWYLRSQGDQGQAYLRGITASIEAMTSPKAAPIGYITAPIERGTITTVIKATGTVNAMVTVDVSSQLSGRIADVLVNFNDEVKAGQPIARVDPETYIARVNEAKAALKIATATVQVTQAALQRAQASVANAQSARTVSEVQLVGVRAKFRETENELERKIKLARTASVAEVELGRMRAQHAVGEAELNAAIEQRNIRSQEISIAEADLRMAEATLRNAEAVVEQKEAALEQAKVDLQRTEILAPIDGIIIKRDVNPGQTVAVSLEAKTLFKIVNGMLDMQVHGVIDEADVGRLRVGQVVNFTVDAHPDRVFAGRLLQIRKSPEVIQNVVTYTAIISAPNTDHLLFPGMTANLRVTISELEDVLKIPNQALSFRPKGHPGERSRGASMNVWVLGIDGKPSPVQVTIGQRDDSGAQLLPGRLAGGQQVIIGIASGGPASGL